MRGPAWYVWLVLWFGDTCEPVSADGIQELVSTPVTPPGTYTVWFLGCVLGIILLNAWLVRRCGPKALPRARAAYAGLSIVAWFLIAFVGCVAGASMILPPGIPLPAPGGSVFWGQGWDEAGWIFGAWNSVGAVCLVGTAVIIVRRVTGARGRSLTRVAFANAAAFTVALAPYVSSGALTHGTVGIYAYRECDLRIGMIGWATMAFARDHDWALPRARDSQELVRQIWPYVSARFPRRSLSEVGECPVCQVVEPRLRTYRWNSALAGRTIGQLRKIPSNTAVIWCPRTDGMGYALCVGDLLEAGDDEVPMPKDTGE